MKVVVDTNVFVSGDKHLLDVGHYGKTRIVRPRAFVEEHLPRPGSTDT